MPVDKTVASATDIDPKGRRKDPVDELADQLKRQQASQAAQARSDLNQQRPVSRRDPQTGTEVYDSAPTAFRRLFGSPLEQKGKYARGPNKERLVTSGWGDPRPYKYGNYTETTIHKGIDYAAPVGEEVYAVADGVVVFTGYQPKEGYGVSAQMPRVDNFQNILDSEGKPLAPRKTVGWGGIFVRIAHAGEFQNYSSVYMHLSEVADIPKDAQGRRRVVEGQLIGRVGISGVQNLDRASPHLHFEIWYHSAKVNPALLVPHFWPGHVDSTNPNAAPRIFTPERAPNLLQAGFNGAASIVNGFYRATTLQNQDLIQVRRTMSNHASRTAQVTGFGQTALYAAASASAVTPPVVSNPMFFNFETGEWNDGKAV